MACSGKVLIYLDDIIVFGRTFDKELQRLTEVFQQFRKANPRKCVLFQQEVPFLAHVVKVVKG